MKIPDRPMAYWLRWFCMPPLVVVVFVVTGIVVSMASSVIGLWDYPCVGAACALVWVLSAYAIVPERKVIVAILAFFIGAIVAYDLLEPCWWPEGTSRPYQPTHLPLIVTYVSGVIAVGIAVALKIEKPTTPCSVRR